MEWIDINKYVPHPGVHIRVKTSWGETRKAIFPPMGMGYMLTDCTHPLQNCHLSEDKILGWQFENNSDFEDGKYSINHWKRQREGEVILNGLRKQSFFNKVKRFLKVM